MECIRVVISLAVVLSTCMVAKTAEPHESAEELRL